MYDWARDTLSRLTFDKADDVRPSWTPDGRRIVFASKRGEKGEQNLYWQKADGTGDVQKLTDGPNAKIWRVVPSERKVPRLYGKPCRDTASDVMILPIEGDEATGWKPGKADSVPVGALHRRITAVFARRAMDCLHLE